MTHTVVGLFDERNNAQSAMSELVAEGFIKENIDLSHRSAAQAGSTSPSSGNEGIGDRITNFFNSLFGDDETTARNYTHAASDAEAILTVQADSDDRARLAQEIMDRNDSIDVDERSSRYAAEQGGVFGSDANAGSVDTGAERRTIPVVEERLDVGKREVERGGARIRSRIVQKPVEESIRLREEHIVINRRPADRAVTDADMQNFKPGEMELTEHAEVPIIGKQARVVEEVEIGKTVTEHNQTVRDTVKSTDVDVERFEGNTDTTEHTKANRAKP